MGIEAQVDVDWAVTDSGTGAAAGATQTCAAGSTYLSDEEILGIEPVASATPPRSSVILSEAKNPFSIARDGDDATTKRDSSGKGSPQNETGEGYAPAPRGSGTVAQMPEWMAALAGDPKAGQEAQALWREHQEFRAAFSSSAEARAVADEARAIKELLPGGVRDAVSLREATASVERIDAALFSGDARAQSEVVTELARANPAAFRSLFAEAARVLAGMGQKAEVGGSRLEVGNLEASTSRELSAGQDADQVTRATGHEPRDTVRESPRFDPAAYASFERATNDAVARDVRGSIGETLARVMPEGVAEGAARRIGEDIFNEVHRALAADRALSEQVAAVLHDRRFGGAEQQRVAALLAGRAKQLVPSVARRVIGEWTSSVLNTARAKASRQALAASRVDIAAPGGSADSMPLRGMPAREVNYASMSDEEILGI
jgi:hypothetical protein